MEPVPIKQEEDLEIDMVDVRETDNDSGDKDLVILGRFDAGGKYLGDVIVLDDDEEEEVVQKEKEIVCTMPLTTIAEPPLPLIAAEAPPSQEILSDEEFLDALLTLSSEEIISALEPVPLSLPSPPSPVANLPSPAASLHSPSSPTYMRLPSSNPMHIRLRRVISSSPPSSPPSPVQSPPSPPLPLPLPLPLPSSEPSEEIEFSEAESEDEHPPAPMASGVTPPASPLSPASPAPLKRKREPSIKYDWRKPASKLAQIGRHDLWHPGNERERCLDAGRRDVL